MPFSIFHFHFFFFQAMLTPEMIITRVLIMFSLPSIGITSNIHKVLNITLILNTLHILHTPNTLNMSSLSVLNIPISSSPLTPERAPVTSGLS